MIRASRGLRMALLVASLAGLVTGLMSWQSIQQERQSGLEDLNRRAGLLVHRVSPAVKENRTNFGASLEGHGRLLGIAIYGEDDAVIASGSGLVDVAEVLGPIVARAAGSRSDVIELSVTRESVLHVLVRPIPEARARVAVVHDASYLDNRMTQSLMRAFFWVFVITLGLLVGMMLLTWVSYEGPLLRLAQWMKGVRMGDGAEPRPPAVPFRLLTEESENLAATLRAAQSSRLTQSSETVRKDNVWTKERLAAHAASCLANERLR